MSPHDPAVATDRHERPVELLRDLIRFETVNPPGNERPCIEWLDDLLGAYGVETETYAADPDRPNLLARIPGGDAPPLLLYGHVDVVPVTGQEWTHDPFEAVLEGGFVWGRGALDMKGPLAMLLAAFLRVADAGEPPAGDLLFLAVADEESGGDEGLGFLVEEHPELFADVEYALGEFGGFSMDVGGVETYPIQVNEKQVCWLEATFRGESGHASLPTTGTATAAAGEFLASLEDTRLPVHVTPPVRAMLEALAAELPEEEAAGIRALTDPERTDATLEAMGDRGRMFDALLHNTASATMVHGGDKENVVPEEVTVFLDCRLVPGQEPADVIAELRAATALEAAADRGVDVDLEVVRYEPGPPDADLGLFGDLAAVIEDATDGVAIPFVLFGASDARHLARVDVQSYGFTPMQLGDLPFLELAHSGDERIPVETVGWGADRVYEAIRQYGEH